MIDPKVLAFQRAVIAGDAIPAEKPLRRLYVVKPARRLKCECGTCRVCKRRDGMRRARGSPGVFGPSFKKGRSCDRCGNAVSDRNKTGLCTRCQKSNSKATVQRRSNYFLDGGGI